jgi:hypothetical protein
MPMQIDIQRMQRIRGTLLLLSLGAASSLLAAPAPAFLNLTPVTATNIRIEWPPVPGAVRYVISRNGAPDIAIDANAGFLQGDRFAYTDIGRRPSTLQTYSVEAQFAAPTPSTRSPVSQVVTPQASPPLGFRATVSGPGAVTLTWQPRAEATSYRILRTGGPVPAATLNPSGLLYVDQNLPAGQYTYIVYSVFKLASGEEFGGEFSNPVTVTFRPFNMIAVGDSVMWGQGLLPQNKFAAKIQAWIQGLLEIPVTLNLQAHSGAITYPDSSTAYENRSYDGEVPADWPTISHQLGLASSSSVPNPAAASDVDLILIDGCANNIGIITVLNPAGKDETLRSDTRAYCGAGMTNLLSDAVAKFPNANIVVTGYFRYVSSESDLAALVPVFSIVGAVIPPDPLFGGVVVTLGYRARAAARSDEFFQESNSSLQSAVDTVNGMTLPGRTRFNQIRFAPLNPTLSNSYAAPNTWQWLIPTPPLVQDEMYDIRAQRCAAVLASVNGNRALLPGVPPLCLQASMGHPNVAGAQAYVDAIKSVATNDIAAWSANHLGPLTTAEDYTYVKVQLGPSNASGGTMIVTAAAASGQPLSGTVQLPGTPPAALGSQVSYTYAANDPADILATINVPGRALRYIQIPARKLSVTISETGSGDSRTTVATAADAITGQSLSGTVTIGQASAQTSQPLTYPPCVPRPPNGLQNAVRFAVPCGGRVHVPFYLDVSFEDVSVRPPASSPIRP